MNIASSTKFQPISNIDTFSQVADGEPRICVYKWLMSGTKENDFCSNQFFHLYLKRLISVQYGQANAQHCDKPSPQRPLIENHPSVKYSPLCSPNSITIDRWLPHLRNFPAIILWRTIAGMYCYPESLSSLCKMQFMQIASSLPISV